MIFDYLFLPIIFFIGAVTSYQDFYYGKIKNKWIFFGLGWVTVIFGASFVWGLAVPFLSDIFGRQFIIILPNYMLSALVNSAISLVVGYLLWYFDAWSAGDAKLFFIFSLLLPLKYYQKSALPYFPSIVLLVNIFIPVVIFLSIISIYHFSLRIVNLFCPGKEKINLREAGPKAMKFLRENKWQVFKILPAIFLMSFVFQLIRYKLNAIGMGQNNWLAAIFLLMSQLMGRLNRIFTKKIAIFLVIFGVIFYVYWTGLASLLDDSIRMMPLLKNSLIMMPIFLIISALLKKLPGETKGQRLPFAFWIFIGVLITIILKGSIASLIIRH